MFFKRLAAAVLACGLLGAIALGSPASAATNDNGTVYVVHGIPGVAVDVYVNGEKTLPNFAPKTVAGPLSLPAATYDVKVFAAGADPASATPVITASVPLPAGANASLVAHLDPSGKPVLTTFVNDASTASAGQGRLIVRHTAAAPAVDVLADGKAAFTNLTNPNEAKADLPAATYSAAVVAAGTTDPVIGPADVPVTAGMATIVYAVGSLQDKTLGVVTQQIPLTASEMSVPTGTSGLLDGPSGVPAWPVAGLVVALITLTGSGVAFARTRS